jgi:hypothetical protein
MAKIDLRTPDARIENGMINNTVSLPLHHRSVGKQSKRGRGESVIAVIDAVYDASSPLSRADIAKALGRAKTPHLVSIIEGLVNDKVLIRYVTVASNGAAMYLYGRPE